jgi:hypothetical protein
MEPTLHLEPAEIRSAVNSMNHKCLSDIVFQIATGAIGQSQVQQKVQEKSVANWEANVRGQERARIKKEQTEVVRLTTRSEK